MITGAKARLGRKWHGQGSMVTVVECGVRRRLLEEGSGLEAALVAVTRHVVVPPLDIYPVFQISFELDAWRTGPQQVAHYKSVPWRYWLFSECTQRLTPCPAPQRPHDMISEPRGLSAAKVATDSSTVAAATHARTQERMVTIVESRDHFYSAKKEQPGDRRFVTWTNVIVTPTYRYAIKINFVPFPRN